ncbi:hypothetical protein PR202_ga21507 [Eleusine coracana subsp. coracana]|uniref:CW-type domain-containing protein n=1 Tax=Eleusine coracana subsp. coracana TaxID=191504 RepID=A0AAV5D0R2_ELECO|nr:hypothetical protein PR202_ga21507 [Eleusine coracana subsp. coracana]
MNLSYCTIVHCEEKVGDKIPSFYSIVRAMRDLPVEDAVDEQATVLEGQKAAADGSSEDSENDSDFVDGNDDLVEDDDVLFVENVDRRVTRKRMSKGYKAASTSTTKVQQVDRSLKAMESNQENSLLSPTKNFICPSPEKRQKVLSDKDGEQRDRHSSDGESQTDNRDVAEDDQGRNNHVSSIRSKRPRHKGLPIGAYAVQCDTCRKWRLVPTKEKYEKIREQIDENPFTCEKAREWKPDVACDDPSEVSQDGSLIWAMDQHNIPQTPPGWERLIMIRSEGCTQFADVTWILVPAEQKYEEFHEQIEEGPFTKYLKENLEYAVQVHPIPWEAPATREDPGDINPPELVQSEPPETKKPGTPPAGV